MAFVYILRCSDGSLYTGWTNDPRQRLDIHNSGKGAKYTRSRLPVEMIYCRQCPDKATALRLEAAIKKLNRQQKLRLIQNAELPAIR